MTNETGWVIERYTNSTLLYWSGRDPNNFSPDNKDAVRFSRAEDASIVLAWICKGQGRVCEHMWCGA